MSTNDENMVTDTWKLKARRKALLTISFSTLILAIFLNAEVITALVFGFIVTGCVVSVILASIILLDLQFCYGYLNRTVRRAAGH